jgi:hypothetical protein
MRLVGEGVHACSHECVAIGLSMLTKLSNFEKLAMVPSSKPCHLEDVLSVPEGAKRDLKFVPNSSRDLDHNHTHFVLAVDEDEGRGSQDDSRRFDQAAQFQSSVLKGLAQIGCKTLMIMANGGAGAVRLVRTRIESKIGPCIIIQGSGRAADDIVLVYQNLVETERALQAGEEPPVLKISQLNVYRELISQQDKDALVRLWKTQGEPFAGERARAPQKVEDHFNLLLDITYIAQKAFDEESAARETDCSDAASGKAADGGAARPEVKLIHIFNIDSPAPDLSNLIANLIQIQDDDEGTAIWPLGRNGTIGIIPKHLAHMTDLVTKNRKGKENMRERENFIKCDVCVWDKFHSNFFQLCDLCVISGAVPTVARGVETAASVSTHQSVFDSRTQSYDHKIPEIFKTHFDNQQNPEFGLLHFPDQSSLENMREKCANESDSFNPFSGENKRAIVHEDDEDEFVSRGDRTGGDLARKALFFVPPFDKKIAPDDFAQVTNSSP